MSDDRHLDAVERCHHGGAEERGEALVIGVSDQGDAGGQQLGPGGGDLDVARAVTAVEGEAVVGTRSVAVLHLSLGDRGLEVDVPEGGGLLAVGLAAREVPKEGALADATAALVDRGVQQTPVDGEPESPEELFEDFLVELDELIAELEEVRPGDRDGPVILRGVAPERGIEIGDVGLAWVAADAEVVLHTTFGGQPVVVPAHWVEDGLAGHPLVAGDRVGVGVGEHVSHVQRAGDGRRRRIDREDAVAVA